MRRADGSLPQSAVFTPQIAVFFPYKWTRLQLPRLASLSEQNGFLLFVPQLVAKLLYRFVAGGHDKQQLTPPPTQPLMQLASERLQGRRTVRA